MDKLLLFASLRRIGKAQGRRRQRAVRACRFERLEDRCLLAGAAAPQLAAATIPAAPSGALVASAQGPTNITLSQSNFLTGSAAGTTVGAFTAVDKQPGPYTFQLVSGAGSTNNADFAIAGNLLKTNSAAASPAVYSIRVQVTDPSGLSLDQVFSIAAVSGPLPLSASMTFTAATVGVSLPGPTLPPWALTPAPASTVAIPSTMTAPTGHLFGNTALFGTTLPGADGAGGPVINPPPNESTPDSNKGNNKPASQQQQQHAFAGWPATVDSIAASAAFPFALGQSSAPLPASAVDAVMAEYADAAIRLEWVDVE
jgi:hypothetical protein